MLLNNTNSFNRINRIYSTLRKKRIYSKYNFNTRVKNRYIVETMCYELSITLLLTIFVRNNIDVRNNMYSLLHVHCIRDWRYIKKDCQVTSLAMNNCLRTSQENNACFESLREKILQYTKRLQYHSARINSCLRQSLGDNIKIRCWICGGNNVNVNKTSDDTAL